MPKRFEHICLKALAIKPVDRYRTAADLAADLNRFVFRQRVQRSIKVAAVGLLVLAMCWCLWLLDSRAGTTTSRYFGRTENHLAEYANCRPVTSETLIAIGKLKPNGYGFFDTLGNVSEWVSDSSGTENQSSSDSSIAEYPLRGGSAWSSPDRVIADGDYTLLLNDLVRPGADGKLIWTLRMLDADGNPSLIERVFGNRGSAVFVADVDGDGKADLGTAFPSQDGRALNWEIDTDGDGLNNDSRQFGIADDLPIVGDWEGTGRTAFGLYRRSTNPSPGAIGRCIGCWIRKYAMTRVATRTR